MEATLQFVDPAQLARISDLQLLARTVVNGMMIGIHRSPNSGSAIEFAQYRPYTQGDDPRLVDWKLFGRTDRLHVKQFHEETNLRCTLVLDCSASMNYGSGEITKFRYSLMLAASLATLLNRQHDATGLIAYHERLLRHLPPTAGARALRTLLATLDGLEPAGRTDANATLRFLGDVLQPRGMIVLISDLLHPLEEMVEQLKTLRARRHDVLVLQIADPAEQTFPFELSQTFIDVETESEQYAIPEEVREQYLENRRIHFDAIRRECLASEIDYEEIVTSEPLDLALHRYLHHRNHALLTKSTTAARRRASG